MADRIIQTETLQSIANALRGGESQGDDDKIQVSDFATIAEGLKSGEYMIADSFDETKAYTIDDIVIYDNKLYKFKAVHLANTPWDVAEVDETNVEDEIDKIHDKLDGITDTVIDVTIAYNPLGEPVLRKIVKNNNTGESTTTNVDFPEAVDTQYFFDTQGSSRGEFRVTCNDSETYPPQQVMIKDGDKLADKDVVAELGAHNLVNITIQSQTIGGITVTNNGDGTVTVNGTNSSGNDLYIKLCDVVIKSGVYFLSGCPEGGETGKCLQFNSIQPYIAPIQDKGNGAYFNTSNQATQTVPLYIAVWENVTVDNWTFKPMVSYYYASRDFHPYAMSNKELTEAVISLQNQINALTNN